jgi:hypothetical protein
MNRYVVLLLSISGRVEAWKGLNSNPNGVRRTPTSIDMAYIERDGEMLSAGAGTQPPRTEPQTEFTGAGTLGDIMSDEAQQDSESGLSRAGLVTLDGGTLAARFGIHSRLDRMALTANGNLQRLFSSYYDEPVHVVVDRCKQVSQELWDRIVHLTVLDQVRQKGWTGMNHPWFTLTSVM